MIMMHDLKDPSDSLGRSYKQINAEKIHNIPIGTLVEIDSDSPESPYAGVRAYVVSHNRDCDMTPLYCLCYDSRDTEAKTPGFGNPRWLNGMPEYCLKAVVSAPAPAPAQGQASRGWE